MLLWIYFTQFSIKDEKHRQRFYGFFWYRIYAPFELFEIMLQESQQKMLTLVNFFFTLPSTRKGEINLKKKHIHNIATCITMGKNE